MSKLDVPTWLTPEGEPVSCLEKIKVLNENLEEIQAMAQEALDDAILMGVDESQFRSIIRKISENIVNTYKNGGR